MGPNEKSDQDSKGDDKDEKSEAEVWHDTYADEDGTMPSGGSGDNLITTAAQGPERCD